MLENANIYSEYLFAVLVDKHMFVCYIIGTNERSMQAMEEGSMRRMYDGKNRGDIHDCTRSTAATTVVICMVILLGTSVLAFAGSPHKEKPVYKYYTSYEIQSGDTLWTIADTYTRGSGVDRRKYMKEIRELNHLDSDDAITSGKYLTVAYYSTDQK